jgi:hypothetical protein
VIWKEYNFTKKDVGAGRGEKLKIKRSSDETEEKK